MNIDTIEATLLRFGGWALEIKGVGVNQVCRLAQAVDEMRDAVVDVTGQPASEMTFEVRPVLEAGLDEALNELNRLQDQANLAQEEAARQRRLTARRLAERHLSGRDIGQLMGVSSQRVSQLLRDAS